MWECVADFNLIVTLSSSSQICLIPGTVAQELLPQQLMVAIFCFDDSFAHFWHTPNQIHELVYKIVSKKGNDLTSDEFAGCSKAAMQCRVRVVYNQ